MKILFLHIPKTAGQSVHTALVNALGSEAVCPARVNDQLFRLSIRELNQYQVFSGHLDWSMLDCIKGKTYSFTVLREPEDRILSFYFYMREQASLQPRHKLQQGMKAALELSPKEYFCGGSPQIRSFLDDHYDNFYTYYFAGRVYQGRGRLYGLIQRGDMTKQDVMHMAKDNMAMLDDVFTVNNMGRVFDKIREISGSLIESNEKYRVNVNMAISAKERKQALIALGADDETFERIRQFCEMDNKLWQFYSKQDDSVAK